MQEIGSIIYFVILYILLMVVLPAKVLRLPLGRKQIADSTVKALLVSYTVCVSWVYALALLHIYNRYTLIAALILTAIVYGFIKKVKYREIIMDTLKVLALLGGGQYRAEIFIKDWIRKVCKSLKEGIRDFFKSITISRIVFFMIGLAALVILMQRRLPAFFETYAYRTSDMYVHNEWINYMEAGDIFSDGIYPFGMHNMLSALHLLSGLHINQIFRYYGALNSLLTVAAAVYFLRRVGQSKAAILIYLMIYGVTDFAGNVFAYRMAFTLPQECAMPFLLIGLLFLGKFLEDKNREDGIYFALASSFVLSTHFFTVIFAVALCGSLVLVYVRKIWKEKLILPLCRCLLLIICISITPFLVGGLEGKSWQGSMVWALSVMQTDDSEEEIQLSDSQEEESTAQEESAIVEADTKEDQSIFYLFWNMMMEKMYAVWGYAFWFGMIYAALYFLLIGKRWGDWRNKQYFAVWLTLVFCVIVLGYWILGIPQLMKEERVRMFIGYLGPILFAIPLETPAVYLGKWGRRISEVLAIGAAAACFYVTYGLGSIPFQSYFYLETSTAAEACVKISEEYKKNTWTVVSPVEEVSFIRGLGYHYELWEFIVNMERYDTDRYLELPTKYVFFILEKKPIAYNAYRIMGQQYEDKLVNMEEADTVVTREVLGISEYGAMKYYNLDENRRAIEAKLAAWLQVYSELFPDQMTVYMESDDCVVYRLEQNEYALNNLAVDYGYNVISDEDYDQILTDRLGQGKEE